MMRIPVHSFLDEIQLQEVISRDHRDFDREISFSHLPRLQVGRQGAPKPFPFVKHRRLSRAVPMVAEADVGRPNELRGNCESAIRTICDADENAGQVTGIHRGRLLEDFHGYIEPFTGYAMRHWEWLGGNIVQRPGFVLVIFVAIELRAGIGRPFTVQCDLRLANMPAMPYQVPMSDPRASDAASFACDGINLMR